jgi:hypothetical protein
MLRFDQPSFESVAPHAARLQDHRSMGGTKATKRQHYEQAIHPAERAAQLTRRRDYAIHPAEGRTIQLTRRYYAGCGRFLRKPAVDLRQTADLTTATERSYNRATRGRVGTAVSLSESQRLPDLRRLPKPWRVHHQPIDACGLELR